MRRGTAWIVMLLAACAGEPEPPADPATSESPSASAQSPAAPAVDTATSSARSASTGYSTGLPVAYPVIHPDGIGTARRGMSLSEIRSALPAGTTLGDLDPLFMVDLSAVPVLAGADTLYHLLFDAAEGADDDARPLLAATMNPRVRTAAGVGPGTTMAEAVAAYGPATLSYNVENESREFAQFDGQPEGILFRARPSDGDGIFAGRYDTDASYNQTTRYDPEARIFMVMVNMW